MRALGLVLVQIVLSLAVVGAVLPIVLVEVPGAQRSSVGLVLVLISTAVVFLVLRLVWPRPRQRR